MHQSDLFCTSTVLAYFDTKNWSSIEILIKIDLEKSLKLNFLDTFELNELQNKSSIGKIFVIFGLTVFLLFCGINDAS